MTRQAERDGTPGATQNTAMLLKVAQTMSKLGVAPLPRNYELYYEALFGQMPALSRAMATLGTGATQAQLDEIGSQYNLIGHSALASEKARTDAAQTISDVLGKVRKNIGNRKTFAESLQAFIARLEADPVVGMSDFAGDAVDFGFAAQTLLKEEQAFALAMEDIAGQLRDITADLDARRKALTRDPVTGLPNRTAFSMRLAALFSEDADGTGCALVLVTIDGLQDLRQNHGSGAVEKVLKKLAPLFRKSIKKNDFVARIAPDEFAFIFDDVSVDNAAAIAGRIRASAEAIEIVLPGRAFARQILSLSAGIAMRQNATGAGDLFQQADLALKSVRANGGSGLLVFSAAIGNQAPKSRMRFVA